MPSATDVSPSEYASYDFYGTLDLPAHPAPSQKDLDRAWRRTALKYHPDKLDPKTHNIEQAKEKFHLAQIAYDILSDPTSRAKYDALREGAERAKKARAELEGRRREMVESLERREREGVVGVGSGFGQKRSRGEFEDEQDKLEREVRRLAEDGKRRRKEREEMLRREIEREKEAQDEQRRDASAKIDGDTSSNSMLQQHGQGVSEIDRTIKVRWAVDSPGGAAITADRISELFSTFGKIDSADLLSPKPLKLGGSKKKQMAVVCMVQFASVVGAHAAVEDFAKQQDQGDEVEWKIFESVRWASGQAPAFIDGGQQQHQATDDHDNDTPSTAPSTPVPKPKSNPVAHLAASNPATTPLSTNGNGVRKMPSFASFSGSRTATPQAVRSPALGGIGLGSPSLEEVTMIRLKEMEKKRLLRELEAREKEEEEREPPAAKV